MLLPLNIGLRDASAGHSPVSWLNPCLWYEPVKGGKAASVLWTETAGWEWGTVKKVIGVWLCVVVFTAQTSTVWSSSANSPGAIRHTLKRPIRIGPGRWI